MIFGTARAESSAVRVSKFYDIWSVPNGGAPVVCRSTESVKPTVNSMSSNGVTTPVLVFRKVFFPNDYNRTLSNFVRQFIRTPHKFRRIKRRAQESPGLGVLRSCAKRNASAPRPRPLIYSEFRSVNNNTNVYETRATVYIRKTSCLHVCRNRFYCVRVIQ